MSEPTETEIRSLAQEIWEIKGRPEEFEMSAESIWLEAEKLLKERGEK
jgi:hypothetical protein